jgi:hypothetical protein
MRDAFLKSHLRLPLRDGTFYEGDVVLRFHDPRTLSKNHNTSPQAPASADHGDGLGWYAEFIQPGATPESRALDGIGTGGIDEFSFYNGKAYILMFVSNPQLADTYSHVAIEVPLKSHKGSLELLRDERWTTVDLNWVGISEAEYGRLIPARGAR